MMRMLMLLLSKQKFLLIMIIQKIKTLSFIASLLIFTSCCKNLYFTLDDTSWVSSYEKQDLLIFKSNLGNLDSILIIDKIVYKADGKCNPLEISSLSKSSSRVTSTNSRSKWK